MAMIVSFTAALFQAGRIGSETKGGSDAVVWFRRRGAVTCDVRVIAVDGYRHHQLVFRC